MKADATSLWPGFHPAVSDSFRWNVGSFGVVTG
jgi:hypothetical protein